MDHASSGHVVRATIYLSQYHITSSYRRYALHAGWRVLWLGRGCAFGLVTETRYRLDKHKEPKQNITAWVHAFFKLTINQLRKGKVAFRCIGWEVLICEVPILLTRRQRRDRTQRANLWSFVIAHRFTCLVNESNAYRL